MKPDTLLNVSKNNSVTISQPVKDPDFITWSSTLSSIRRHDTGLVIDCDPTQPLDKSFAPEVDVSCQTAPEVETFTTVDESDEEGNTLLYAVFSLCWLLILKRKVNHLYFILCV